MKANERLVSTETIDLPPMNRAARFSRWCRVRRVRLLYESYYPGGYALISAGVCGLWGLTESDLGKLFDNVLPFVATLATVLVGFQATAHSVLLSLIGSQAWEYLKRVGHQKRLVNYLWASSRSLMIFITLSLAVMVAGAIGYDCTRHTTALPALLGGLLVHAGFSSYRIGHLMTLLLKQSDVHQTSA